MGRYILAAMCLLLMGIRHTTQARTIQLTNEGPREDKVGDISKQLMHYRRKRASIFIARAAFEGIKAAKKIISGSKQITTSTSYREFEKSGSLTQAIKDFQKLKASDTLDFKMPGGGYGKAGKVGDRQFILQVNGDGKTIIDVIQIEDARTEGRKKSVYGKITDRISYKD